MNATEDKPWPDKRIPDNSALDKRLIGFGVDPVSKRSLNGIHVSTLDYQSNTGAAMLAMALGGAGLIVWDVVVRPAIMTYAPGPLVAVGDAVVNCTESPMQQTIEWKHTVSTTTSFSLTVGMAASFYEVLNASVSASFSMSWTDTKEFGKSYKEEVKPKHVGWLDLSPWLQTVTGEIWILQSAPGSKQPIAAYWGNGTMTGVATDGRPLDALVGKERPLSAQDEQRYCSILSGQPAPTLPAALLDQLMPHPVTGTAIA